MDDDSILTAEQGADRVAERLQRMKMAGLRSKAPIETNDLESTPDYTCENCGGHVFKFVHAIDEEQTMRLTLACACGETDVAATRDFLVTRTRNEVGRLLADHNANLQDEDFEDEGTCEEVDREEVESEVFCQRCSKQAGRDEWESEVVEDWHVNEDANYFEVRCAGCNHEMEFGWSHPDRGGRVWPCESADFNPWKTWPEPRFVPAWEGRGWLRPAR